MAQEVFKITLEINVPGDDFDADPEKNTYEYLQKRIQETGIPRAQFFLDVLGFDGSYEVKADIEYTESEQKMLNEFYSTRQEKENKIRDEMEADVERAIHAHTGDEATPVRVIYSVYDYDYDGNIVNNLYDIAFQGKCRLVIEGDGFFGNGKEYASPVLLNPQWIQVAIYANEMIEATGNSHHVFLEGLQANGFTQDGDITILKFIMGS